MRMRIEHTNVKLVLVCVCTLAVAAANASSSSTVRLPTYRVLQDAQGLLEEQRYDDTIARLTKLLPRIEGNGYESALALQLMAYAHVLREDIDAAIPLLESGMTHEGLPPELQYNYLHTLTQLYLRKEQFQKAISLLSAWLDGNPDELPQLHALLGQACYFEHDYRCADIHLSTAIGRSDEPPENWQHMLLATYYKLEAYDDAKRLLIALLARHPDRKHYWLYLSNVELLLDNVDDALATLQMAYRRGVLTDEEEILQLVRLHLFTGNLYTGASILERSSGENRVRPTAGNMRMLANGWLAARERSASVAAIDAALALATDADEILQLSIYKAEVLLQLENWPEVIALLQSLADDPGNARVNLLLGIAAYQQGEADLSKRALSVALRSADTKDYAAAWLQLLE